MALRIFILLALAWGAPSFPAEVLRVGKSLQVIAVSQDKVQIFRTGERLCVISEERVCGKVIKSVRGGAIVRLEKRGRFINRGDLVERDGGKTAATARPQPAVRSSGRAPARAQPPTQTRRPQPARRTQSAALLDDAYQPSERVRNTPDFNLSGGISAGFTFFYPMVHFQMALSSYVSLGFMPQYFKASVEGSSVSSLGAMLTLNYHGNEYYRGFWGQLGAGFQRIVATTATVEESSGVPVFLLTGGWRGYWDLGLNVGVGAGLQYLIDPDFDSTEIRATGIQPVVVLDIGINF